MPKYRVRLSATLPATASMIVDAESEVVAGDYAECNYCEADWMGSDIGDTPQGCDVKIESVEEESSNAR